MNLVPFQDKRKKVINETVEGDTVLLDELTRYWKKHFPETAHHIHQTKPLQQSLLEAFTPVLLPKILLDTTLPWTTKRLEAPLDACITFLEILENTKDTAPKKRYHILPKPYQKVLKRIYTAQPILDAYAKDISSKKKAKKTLRILQKRLGIYAKKKPPFTKIVKPL